MSWLKARSKSFSFPEECSNAELSAKANFSANRGRQVVHINVEKEEAKTDPRGTPFFRLHNLLCLLSPVVRVAFWFWTSCMIILTMCLSGAKPHQLASKPRCQTPSYAAVKFTNKAPAFFLASKKSLMFCESRTT